MRVDEQMTELKLARLERGWSQARAVSALMTQAKAAGIRIADAVSLKTMLSRWENGRQWVDQMYQRFFCQIYQRTPEDLGFTLTLERATGSPRVAPTLDTTTVAYFQNVFGQHLMADNLMGPHHLVDVVRGQSALLDQVLDGARGDVRAALTRLAFKYNEFTGWLYQDAGDPANAMTFTDRAMDYALADGTPTDVAYLLMRKTNIANDMANPARALGLSDAGLRDPEKIAPRVRALVLVQRARAYALDRDPDRCARAIEEAYRQVGRAGGEVDELAAYCTPEYIQMEAAASWTELGRPSQAVPALEQALATWPTQMRRDLGLCQTRLAIAHAATGDEASACRIGGAAVVTASAATSVRTLRDLRRLRVMLAPWRRDASVSELTERIRQLTRAA